MMGEAIGVVLHIAIKYLKSSALRRSRKIGFMLTIAIAIYFSVYFAGTGQYWLCGSSLANVVISVRGTVNNRSIREF